ncbi:AAA family ATPase [Labrenzia sp. CE80]|uniref:AAA family ATPase n=1 Tax=Labrenzia sp. CE80 TaxID=1788986 RepID=UPI00129B8A7F|nr:AAA family ATPase [Labrenzia sp. CE80]
MLIIFSGLPGTGKTSIARALASDLQAVYLRVDTIEKVMLSCQAIKTRDDIGPAGYDTARAVALDNLRLGRWVILDSVNSVSLSRENYHETARDADVSWLDVWVVCSDKEEHRQRVEQRKGNSPDIQLPDWQAVKNREFEPWSDRQSENLLQVDTARHSPGECIAQIKAQLRSRAG